MAPTQHDTVLTQLPCTWVMYTVSALVCRYIANAQQTLASLPFTAS